MLSLVTKSVSWPIISMYFISTYRTQLIQRLINRKTRRGKLLAQVCDKVRALSHHLHVLHQHLQHTIIPGLHEKINLRSGKASCSSLWQGPCPVPSSPCISSAPTVQNYLRAETSSFTHLGLKMLSYYSWLVSFWFSTCVKLGLDPNPVLNRHQKG
jgi:hypothetical protein